MLKRLLGCALLLVSCLMSEMVAAECKAANVSQQSLEDASELGLHLQAQLQHHNPEVALLARVGSDLSEYNMIYSHMAFVIRDHPQGEWMVVHLLNHCGSAKSALFAEGLVQFFLDDPFRYQVKLTLLPKDYQRNLLKVLRSPALKATHQRRYNMLANPFSLRYQNSNQWILEILAQAQTAFIETGSRSNAQRILKLGGYQAESIKVGFFKRLGATLFKDNIDFEEQNHPNSQVHFVSARSIINYLIDNQLIKSEHEYVLGNLQPITPHKYNTTVDNKTALVKPPSKVTSSVVYGSRNAGTREINATPNGFWQ